MTRPAPDASTSVQSDGHEMSEPTRPESDGTPDDATSSGGTADRVASDTTGGETSTSGDDVVEVAPEDVDVDGMPGGARSAIEAVLMVVEEPVTVEALASALEITPTEVSALLENLAAEYDRDQRGFSLRRQGTGWRIYSRAEYAPVVERFVLDGQRAKLSKAALETLAVIAYRQPISRARVAAVRGVSVDGVVRTLITRGLIDEVGTDAEHGAVLYGTTDYFLTRLGLGSLQELPPLAPYLPEGHEVDDIAERGGI